MKNVTIPKPPKPHYTPMSDLSWPRRIRRIVGAMFGLSLVAMGVSASTASTDWGLTTENTT